MSRSAAAFAFAAVLLTACQDSPSTTSPALPSALPIASVVATDSGGTLVLGGPRVKAALALRTQATGTGCVASPSGLSDWWAGDGNAGDLVGGVHGAALNGATFTPGLVTSGSGEAFLFDGIDAIVEVPDAPSLNPTTAFSVEAWARLDSFQPGNGNVVGKGHPFQEIFGMDLFNGVWRTFIRLQSNGPALRIHAGTPQLGVWVHLALTWDGAVMSFYRDGVLAGTVSVPTINSSSGFLGIGHRSELGFPDNQQDVEFDGAIEEVGFYDRALTASEVAGIVSAGSYGRCKGTVTVIAEDATTATVEIAFLGAPTLIGFRTGPTSSSGPSKANGAVACAPLFSPTSPAQTTCAKDLASAITVFAVHEGDGPERSIGSVNIPATTPSPSPPGESLTIVTQDASTVTIELTYVAPVDPGEAIGARSGPNPTSAPVCPPFSTPGNIQNSPATTTCQRGPTDYQVFGIIQEPSGSFRAVGPVVITATPSSGS